MTKNKQNFDKNQFLIKKEINSWFFDKILFFCHKFELEMLEANFWKGSKTRIIA